MADRKKSIPVKIKDEIAGGVYTNNMMVAHTREEFVMDYLYVTPTQGVVTARVITSPSHMKRIVKALQDNISKYEGQFGKIIEPVPVEPVLDMEPN